MKSKYKSIVVNSHSHSRRLRIRSFWPLRVPKLVQAHSPSLRIMLHKENELMNWKINTTCHLSVCQTNSPQIELCGAMNESMGNCIFLRTVPHYYICPEIHVPVRSLRRTH